MSLRRRATLNQIEILDAVYLYKGDIIYIPIEQHDFDGETLYLHMTRDAGFMKGATVNLGFHKDGLIQLYAGIGGENNTTTQLMCYWRRKSGGNIAMYQRYINNSITNLELEFTISKTGSVTYNSYVNGCNGTKSGGLTNNLSSATNIDTTGTGIRLSFAATSAQEGYAVRFLAGRIGNYVLRPARFNGAEGIECMGKFYKLR